MRSAINIVNSRCCSGKVSCDELVFYFASNIGVLMRDDLHRSGEKEENTAQVRGGINRVLVPITSLIFSLAGIEQLSKKSTGEKYNPSQ